MDTKNKVSNEKLVRSYRVLVCVHKSLWYRYVYYITYKISFRKQVITLRGHSILYFGLVVQIFYRFKQFIIIISIVVRDLFFNQMA